MSATAEKKRILEEMLQHGTVMLHLDARQNGVAVPGHLEGEYHLRLNVDYNFRLPVFEIDDDGVQASLSFSGRRFVCVVPWAALFALTSNQLTEGFVWGADLPEELRDFMETVEAEGEDVSPPAPKRPELRLVKSDAPNSEEEENSGEAAPDSEDPPPADAPEAPDAPDAPDAAPKRPHLRLVE